VQRSGDDENRGKKVLTFRVNQNKIKTLRKRNKQFDDEV